MRGHNTFFIKGIVLDKPAYVISDNFILSNTGTDADEQGCLLTQKECESSNDIKRDIVMFYFSIRVAVPMVNLRIYTINSPHDSIIGDVLAAQNTSLTNYYLRIKDPSQKVAPASVPDRILEIDESVIKRIALCHEMVTSYFRAFNEHLRTNPTRWEYAFNQYISCCSNSSLDNSILDIISGLETLLVHGEGQLSYKVALYCSIFISDNYIDRKEIFDLVKKMYNLRSKIVHGR